MKTYRSAARTRAAALALSLVLVPAGATAQTAELPIGSSILADYVAAIGGRDAYDKLQSLHMSGTIAMPALGAEGTVELYSARPAMKLMVITVPGVGDVMRGTNGKVAWSLDPFTGPQVVTGPALASVIEASQFDAMVLDPADFTSVETLTRTTKDGRDCYNVRLVRKDGRMSMNCFDVTDHLLVATVEPQQSAAGEFSMTTFLRGYRDVAGVKLPMQLVVSGMGQEQVLTLTAVEANSVEPSRFDLPAEIRVLVDQQ